ncbi:hypothetical protein SAMN05443270_3004 [Lacrimispora sphenoides]|nr:hypothetical protein SAMN05443270_3004 [Lacrimispora sphenoides]
MRKYIKAIVIHLDPFKSEVIFEKNYRHDEVDIVKNKLSEYDYGGNICQAYEMSVDMS